MRPLAEQVSAHIQSQKPEIRTNPKRQPEYMPLASVLAQLHTALDRPRRPRPRNRHVVDDDQGVDIEVTARDGQGVLRTIRGKLGNFSVGDDGWKPGAWVTTIEAPWP